MSTAASHLMLGLEYWLVVGSSLDEIVSLLSVSERYRDRRTGRQTRLMPSLSVILTEFETNDLFAITASDWNWNNCFLCFLCLCVFFVYISHFLSIISLFCMRLSYIIKTYLI